MASDYKGALERIKTLLEAQFTAADSTRLVTRRYRDFADHKDADLRRGIYTIVALGVDGYEYEASDNPVPDGDGPKQTELGRFGFTIVGQGRLGDKEDGTAIEDAEFAMLAEIEQFADAGITDVDLKDLLLRRTVMSQQLEAPFYWVYTEWRLRIFD